MRKQVTSFPADKRHLPDNLINPGGEHQLHKVKLVMEVLLAELLLNLGNHLLNPLREEEDILAAAHNLEVLVVREVV